MIKTPDQLIELMIDAAQETLLIIEDEIINLNSLKSNIIWEFAGNTLGNDDDWPNHLKHTYNKILSRVVDGVIHRYKSPQIDYEKWERSWFLRILIHIIFEYDMYKNTQLTNETIKWAGPIFIEDLKTCTELKLEMMAWLVKLDLNWEEIFTDTMARYDDPADWNYEDYKNSINHINRTINNIRNIKNQLDDTYDLFNDPHKISPETKHLLVLGLLSEHQRKQINKPHQYSHQAS